MKETSPKTQFDFAAILADLQRPDSGPLRASEGSWLPASWKQPGEFMRQLLRYHAAQTHAPLKSNSDAGYDLYHDLVLRHIAFQRTALRWRDHESLPRSLTYAELHALCDRRCAAWTAQGVRAGDNLGVIAAMGPEPPELVVPLLTGLRMGLVVSLLPPLGSDFLLRRLDALGKKARIATAPRYLPLLDRNTHRKQVLSDDLGSTPRRETADASSHTYGKREPALQLFSPLREPQEEPIKVTAALAYLGALRDGLMILDLRPGRVVAAPEQHLLPLQPALLLTTLMQGATYLHMEAKDFAPGLPSPIVPNVLFCNARLRDAMLRLPARLQPRQCRKSK